MKVTFFARCPVGHGPIQEFEPEKLRALLDRGELRFFCITCGIDWAATENEAKNAKHLLEHGSAL